MTLSFYIENKLAKKIKKEKIKYFSYKRNATMEESHSSHSEIHKPTGGPSHTLDTCQSPTHYNAVYTWPITYLMASYKCPPRLWFQHSRLFLQRQKKEAKKTPLIMQKWSHKKLTSPGKWSHFQRSVLKINQTRFANWDLIKIKKKTRKKKQPKLFSR